MISHELNSTMILVHPPLAIAGYVLTFLFTIALFFYPNKTKRGIIFLGITAWLLTLLGLVSGMIWAQVAWGNYWSWDPKEISTLVLFGAVSASFINYYEGNVKLARGLSVLSCVLVLITAMTSFVPSGLHSFA